MRHEPLAATLALLLALPFGARPQDSGREARERAEDQAQDAKATSEQMRARNARVLKAMQGGWMLVELEVPDLEEFERQQKAVLLVADEFLSIELHLGYYRDRLGMIEGYFQSGTHRIRFDSTGRLETTLLIGASTAAGEGIEFEEPGSVRLFEVKATEDRLELLREDGARFEFSKMRTEEETRDFFGRRLRDADLADPERDR